MKDTDIPKMFFTPDDVRNSCTNVIQVTVALNMRQTDRLGRSRKVFSMTLKREEHMINTEVKVERGDDEDMKNTKGNRNYKGERKEEANDNKIKQNADER